MKREDLLNRDIPLDEEEIAFLCKFYPLDAKDYFYKQSEIVMNRDNCKVIASDNKLLRRALIDNYEMTIDILIENGIKVDVEAIRDILIDNYFYIEEGMMDFFVHVNPELINISLINDAYSTIEFLNKNRVLTKPSQREEFIQLLKDINYVVSPSNLNMPLMYHDALRVSLENDEKITLSTRVWETLAAIANDDELYVEYMARLEKYLTSEVDEEDKYYIDEMMYAINFDATLLFSCLSSREGHYKFLEHLNRCPINIRLDDGESLELFNVLKDMNYTIANFEEYPDLLEKNVNFLLASLDNDYEGTVAYLKQRYSSGDREFIVRAIKEIISEDEYDRYKDILTRHNFANNGKELIYLYLDHNALRVLSEIDVNKALTAMSIIDKPQLVIPAYSGAIMLRNILNRIDKVNEDFIQDDLCFRLMPSIEMVSKKRNINTPEGKYVIEAFNKGILPMSFISSSYFSNDEIMNRLNINSDVKKILKKISSKFYKYDKEDEKTLLKILNKNTLQEVLISIEDKSRRKLSIEEVLSLELFGIKTLQENDLDYRLDLFGYSDDYDELGSENNEDYFIELYNGHNRTVYELVKTMYHEINHALQFRHVMEADFFEDEDILEYAKDDILKMRFDNYYKDNYNSISYEYDTDIKAGMLTDALFGDFSINDSYLACINFNSKYSKSMLRDLKEGGYNFQNKSLDFIFDLLIGSIKIDEDFLSKYKCLIYEYNFNERIPRRYSVSELVSKIVSNIDEEEKKKYLVVLKHSLDPRRNYKYKENRRELLQLDKDKKIPLYLAHEINLYNPIMASKKECSKYLTYLDDNFDKIKKMLTKKHRKNNINK